MSTVRVPPAVAAIAVLPNTWKLPTSMPGVNRYWPASTGLSGSLASTMYTPLPAPETYTYRPCQNTDSVRRVYESG